jgi:tetratricopeptide (TPR) repeat protein
VSVRSVALGVLLGAAHMLAVADQSAPELDMLFARLSGAETVAQAAAVERRIWDLWLQSGDSVVDAMLLRGIDAMQSGDLDLAVEQFSRVVERAPRFAEGWNKRATAHFLRRDMAASVADIERTLALEPRHFGAVSGMGLIFLDRGDLVGALGAFERVLEIHPRSTSARVHLHQIREQLRGRAA